MKRTFAKALIGAALFAAPAFAGQDFLADVTQGALTKTTQLGSFGVSIPTFTYGTAVYNMRTGWITRTSSSGYVASEMMQRYKNEMNRVLVTQYR